MADEALAIRRLATRFRLRRGVRVGRLRLEGLVRDAAAGALESALARAGVPVDEDICIRRVQARTALDLARTDAALAFAWSAALATAIRAAIDGGGDEIVRYPTRRLALVDLVAAVARGDLRHAWAWRQLELWPARDVAAGPAACAEAARVLAAHPRLAVPVLREVARRGALPALVAQLAPTALAAIAEAVLPGATRNAAATAAPDEESVAVWQPAAARLARRSVVASAAAIALAGMRGEPAIRTAPLRRALAVLSLIDAEPGVAGRSATASARLLTALETTLAPEANAPGGSPSASARRRPGRDNDAPPPAHRAGEAEPAAARSDDAAAPPTAEPRTEAPLLEPLERRDRGTTRAAGLLFLIHVAGDLDLPRDFLNLAPLCERPLPWTLHRLALALRPLAADDAAALAFAGLGPRGPVPADDDPPTEAEARAIAGAADRVVDRLRVRMARPEQPREALLDEVCARRAEILADPGSIEVRLDLEEVSPALRRAGLDLDPAWVPWLGVVVRFVYA